LGQIAHLQSLALKLQLAVVAEMVQERCQALAVPGVAVLLRKFFTDQ
jgi:hypothetical protein